MLGLATFAGQLGPILASLMPLFGGWLLLVLLLRFLKALDSKEKMPAISASYDFLVRNVTQNVCKLQPNLQEAELQIIKAIEAPGDTSAMVNARYAELIGMVDSGQALPSYLNQLIIKRILFEYKSVHGDLKMRLLAKNRLTVNELLAPVAPEKKQALAQFCLSPI